MNACPGGSYVEFEDVGGDDDGGGRGFAERDADRAVDQVGQLLGHGAHLHVVAADVFEQAEQVDFLLVGAAHRRAFGLSDDGHHRHVVELGVVEAVEQVYRSRAAGRHAHPDLAGELGESDGFEGRHLLVAGLHELRFVAGALPGRQQAVDAVPGEAEDLLHTPFPQPGEQDICNGF